MNQATGILRPCNNFLHGTNQFANILHFDKVSSNHWSLKINPQGNISSGRRLVSKAVNLPDRWMEFQGINNWEGLLDPLDDGLRDEILRYGEFVLAAYRCFDFDTYSPGHATCVYPKASMLSECGLNKTGYEVTKNLHATCGVQLPSWTDRMPSWVSTQSGWIGYVAVCNDKNEITRLGRREVVIAYRGTATCMEWLENLRARLTCLPADMASDHSESMVQSGFLSLYTSNTGKHPSLQDSIREEIHRIVRKYSHEPLSITVTGHSLGAALAILTAYDITSKFKNAPLVTVFSFGGPRVGNKNFRSELEKTGTKVLRIVNSDDPITRVPGIVLEENGENVAAGLSNWLQRRAEETPWAYCEIGKELRVSSRDCPDLVSDKSIATCHDIKTYLHLVDNFISSNCPIKSRVKSVLKEEEQLLIRLRKAVKFMI